MTLKFPRQADVKLGRSPLTQVICQVRFSPILRIGTEPPVAFQEALRQRFPIFGVEQSFGFQIPTNVPLSQGTPSFQLAPHEYRLASADQHTYVTLAQNFFALSTDRYTVWEHFVEDLQLVTDAVVAEYRPSLVHRVGLRYINELSAERLGLATLEDVIGLVQPELVAQLAAPAWSTPKSFGVQLEIDDDEATLAIRVGLQPDANRSARSLILDFDYYEEGAIQVDSITERCTRYHSKIYDAFRWAIRDDQFSVFEPIQ